MMTLLSNLPDHLVGVSASGQIFFKCAARRCREVDCGPEPIHTAGAIDPSVNARSCLAVCRSGSDRCDVSRALLMAPQTRLIRNNGKWY